MSGILFYITRIRNKLKKKSDFFRNFCRNVFAVSRIVPKNLNMGPLGVFEHPFFCKMEKIEGGTLWGH